MTFSHQDQTATINEWPVLLNLEMTDDGFFEFCQLNRDLRIERDKNRTISIMPPTGFDTGNFNSEIGTEVTIWNRKNKLGKVGESSTGYTLPNGAVRSPDVSWVSNERLAPLTEAQLKKFPPVCPDFVIEICSPSDKLPKVKQKMQEYIENGCRLAWLIDREHKQVFIYRADGTISLVKSFEEKISGEDVLPGFEIILANL